MRIYELGPNDLFGVARSLASCNISATGRLVVTALCYRRDGNSGSYTTGCLPRNGHDNRSCPLPGFYSRLWNTTERPMIFQWQKWTGCARYMSLESDARVVVTRFRTRDRDALTVVNRRALRLTI